MSIVMKLHCRSWNRGLEWAGVQGSLTQFRRRLLAWYDKYRRELPWRLPREAATGAATLKPIDPYHVLVSEFMLQQTQMATVIPYFTRFIDRFPHPTSLATADEQEVLRLWQGLGYYSRARNLQRAAKKIVADFAGKVPSDAESLRSLPGVGRYTAGAIASIAFGKRVPILDGNVIRVLCRLDRIASDPRQPSTQEMLWERAEQILPTKRLGDFNSALMELGALICTPRAPQCLLCPLRDQCDAFTAGDQEKIPAPRKAKATPLLQRWTFCIRHEKKWLIEQRPMRGRWAGMWQFVTIEADKSPVTAKSLTGRLPIHISEPKHLGTITHSLTHRRYQFDVYRCEASNADALVADHPRRWVTLDEISRYPLPRPHLKMAAMLPTS